MKKSYCYIILSLLFSLFVYMFYRTEKTVINEIVISIISLQRFIGLKSAITNTLPLHHLVIYSLPEGLWVFCITLTSKSLFLRLVKREYNLIFLPLVFSIGLEMFQLFHLTNGQFDFWDIALSLLFWVVAVAFVKPNPARQNICKPITARSIVCVFTYLVVYLAHVWR